MQTYLSKITSIFSFVHAAAFYHRLFPTIHMKDTFKKSTARPFHIPYRLNLPGGPTRRTDRPGRTFQLEQVERRIPLPETK